MKKKTPLIVIAIGVLGLFLTGCGDDTPLEQEVEQIEKTDDAVNDLNELTKDSEDIINSLD